MTTHTNPPPRPARSRGSVLIVSLILCAVIGISLASYLQLGRSGLEISNRALYSNAAMNLAENGLEEAMYAINKTVADNTYSWSGNGWDTASPVPAGDARRQLPASGTYSFAQGATGTVRVYVIGYASTAPRALSRGTVTLASGQVVEKWVEVRLRRTSKFANGLVAKDSITFKGSNANVDSWDSGWDPDNPSAALTPYSAGVRNDNGSVGSISVAVDAVLVKQADVWGYVSTGGTDPTTTVGTNGSILGDTSAYDPATWTTATVDPSRVATDFSASFDEVTAPTYDYDLGTVNADLDLPDPSHSARSDGKYYYRANNIVLVNDMLRATGNKKVVLVVDGDVSIGGGTGTIRVDTGSELAMYVDGNVTIAGIGAANGTPSNPADGPTEAECQPPAFFQIYGTGTSTQTFDVTGNGALSGVVYAPNAEFIFRGNATILGSVVADSITATGNAVFHYDESLGNFGGDNPYRISLWKEVTTAAERSAITVLGW